MKYSILWNQLTAILHICLFSAHLHCIYSNFAKLRTYLRRIIWLRSNSCELISSLRWLSPLAFLLYRSSPLCWIFLGLRAIGTSMNLSASCRVKAPFLLVSTNALHYFYQSITEEWTLDWWYMLKAEDCFWTILWQQIRLYPEVLLFSWAELSCRFAW